MIRPPRALSREEIEVLLALDVPARLATIDAHGFPHVTPLWFVWAEGAFYLTSYPDRPHLRRLERNPRAGLCIDVEQPDRGDGERRNRQVRAVGPAELFADVDRAWTQRIDEKYTRGQGAAALRVRRAAAGERTVIRLRPDRLVAVASR